MDPVTSRIMYDSSFWQDIPAAGYVLLGVIISGVFTIFSNWRNSKNNKELKELENKNNKELKELENKNNKEIQILEIKHKEKLQELKEKSDKRLRLLDDKLKAFSDFFNDFSEINSSGTKKYRLDNIQKFNKTAYKVYLLVPSIKDKVVDLDKNLTDYANFYIELIEKTKNPSEKEKKKKIKEFTNKINRTSNQICDLLNNEL